MITAPRRTPPKGKTGPRTRRVPPPRRSFLERYRNRLLWAGLAAVVAVGAGLVYVSFTAKGYSCLSEWTPPATAAPAPSATPQIGFFQDDLGHFHVPVGTSVKYAYCPPASGEHYNQPGVAGPIQAKLYGPNDKTVPQNWIHNLEHGGLVVLYRCASGDNCDANQQAALQAFYNSFPNSPVCNFPKGQIGPVITRFDEMAFPYAALLWDMVLPMNQWDPNLTLQFFAQNGERTNREQLCTLPTPTPGPGETTTPSGSAGPTDTTGPSSPAASPAPTSS